MIMATYIIATSPLDYMLAIHLDEHAHSLHDIRRPNSFRSSDYLPELFCPPCDPCPGWKNDFWVTDRSAPDGPHYRLCHVPGCVQLCRSYGDDPHDETLESISCSLGCARTLIQHYERTHLSGTTDALHLASAPAPLLDDLALNAHEKDYAAQNLIEIMSNQFTECQLSRRIVPRNPSGGVHHHPAHASLAPTVYLDLSFDEIFDNTIPRPAVDFLCTPRSPTWRTASRRRLRLDTNHAAFASVPCLILRHSKPHRVGT